MWGTRQDEQFKHCFPNIHLPSALTVVHGPQLELAIHPALLCCFLEVFQGQLVVLKGDQLII